MAEEKNGNGKKSEPNPEFDNFQQLLKQVVSIPKKELDERRVEYEREKKRRKQTG